VTYPPRRRESIGRSRVVVCAIPLANPDDFRPFLKGKLN
jgi:hypothetical protein